MTCWQQSWKTNTKPNSTITTVGFYSSLECVRPASECEETQLTNRLCQLWGTNTVCGVPRRIMATPALLT